MGVEILEGRDFGPCALTCNTSGVAFGPLFEDREEAEAFLEWLPQDPRRYDDQELGRKYSEFRSERLEVSHLGTA